MLSHSQPIPHLPFKSIPAAAEIGACRFLATVFATPARRAGARLICAPLAMEFEVQSGMVLAGHDVGV